FVPILAITFRYPCDAMAIPSIHLTERRAFLQVTSAAGMAAVLPATGKTQDRDISAWRNALINYLQNLAQPDGGYAWAGQNPSHLTPTFAVIGCYKLLGIVPPNKK